MEKKKKRQKEMKNKKKRKTLHSGEDPRNKGSSGAHSGVLPSEMGNAFLFPF